MKYLRHMLVAFITFLLQWLPQRSKKIIFIASIDRELVDQGVLHDITLARINAKLGLSHSDEAFNLPATLYRQIWDRDKVHEIVKEIDAEYERACCIPPSESRRISINIVSICPKWLRYGKNDEMVLDVMQMFDCHSTA